MTLSNGLQCWFLVIVNWGYFLEERLKFGVFLFRNEIVFFVIQCLEYVEGVANLISEYNVGFLLWVLFMVFLGVLPRSGQEYLRWEVALIKLR